MSREEGEIGSESREKGDLFPCSSPLLIGQLCLTLEIGVERFLTKETNQENERRGTDICWNGKR